MFKKIRTTNQIQHADGGPITFPNPLSHFEPHNHLLEAQAFQLLADIFLINGLIEASEALYSRGHKEQAVERINGTLLVLERICHKSKMMDDPRAHEIVAMAQKLHDHVRSMRPDFVSGAFYTHENGQRRSNRVDRLLNELTSEIEMLSTQ